MLPPSYYADANAARLRPLLAGLSGEALWLLLLIFVRTGKVPEFCLRSKFVSGELLSVLFGIRGVGLCLLRSSRAA